VLTQPGDLADESLRDVLRSGWKFCARSLAYQAVGFGSHHWLAADDRGGRFFVTADDLAARRRTPDDTLDAAFGRLDRAFATALSLRREAGLDFVIAPVPARDGRVLERVGTRYSVVVHPYVTGDRTGRDGAFDRPADRREVLELLIALHAARAEPPPADDFAVPRVTELIAAMDQTGAPWRDGPYGTRARDLLATHAAGLTALLAAYADLAARVSARPDRMVITHGEPHSANVLRTTGGLALVDWDTVLLAPPERDLWGLAEADAAIPSVYAAATGVPIDDDALTLYRLWYDLAEIAEYVSLFQISHGDTADTAEAWRNLRHFLRPAERWPHLLAGRI
jgi:spectinomycin phosphotransferase/16S rRNA (guanine(1405)-N(7))-methyltransferase